MPEQGEGFPRRALFMISRDTPEFVGAPTISPHALKR